MTHGGQAFAQVMQLSYVRAGPMYCQPMETRGGHPGWSREVGDSEFGVLSCRHQEVLGCASLGGNSTPSGSEHRPSCRDIGMNVGKQERPSAH